MRENPVRGYAVPKERNVRRPIATQDRFELLRARSDEHKAFFGQSGTLDHRRSYLSELLDIVNGTGRRISAVCSLCVDDLRLQRTKQAPHGAIVWPASTDKMKRQSTIPVSPTVRTAIDRMLAVRMEIGHVPLFPAPEDPTKALSRHTANKWLIEGEKLAEVEKQKGGLWHPYRRKWATERSIFLALMSRLRGTGTRRPLASTCRRMKRLCCQSCLEAGNYEKRSERAHLHAQSVFKAFLELM